jgi:hypothetical protein
MPSTSCLQGAVENIFGMFRNVSPTVTQKFQYIESDMVFNAGDIFFEIVIEIQADISEL